MYCLEGNLKGFTNMLGRLFYAVQFSTCAPFALHYSAYTGRFCDEDLDGCTELTCFAGVECMDVPAPGVRATCGPCPPGYTGLGLNCIGMYIIMYTYVCMYVCLKLP